MQIKVVLLHKFYFTIAVHTSDPAKYCFWLVATQKKRIGEQVNYFWNMCPNAFHERKIKEIFFSDGKSKGPLSAL